MAANLLQHNLTTPSSNYFGTYAGAQGAGNTNIVCLAYGTTTPVTVSDSSNGAYTQVGINQTNGQTVAIFQKTNIAAAGAGTNVVSFSNGGYGAFLELMEWYGLDGTTDGFTGNSDYISSINTGNLTTLNANDLLIAFWGEGNTWVSDDAAWTPIEHGTQSSSLYKIVGSTGTYSATWNTTGTNNWAAAIAAFKITVSTPVRPGLIGSSSSNDVSAPKLVLRPNIIHF